MGLLSLLGLGNKKEKINEFSEKGALVLDVRTPQEYKQGHVSASLNIPLDKIPSKMEELKRKNKPYIACCASGMRSGAAASQLRKNGIDCINGGSWQSVDKVLSTKY